jgi:hypothetical protein
MMRSNYCDRYNFTWVFCLINNFLHCTIHKTLIKSLAFLQKKINFSSYIEAISRNLCGIYRMHFPCSNAPYWHRNISVNRYLARHVHGSNSNILPSLNKLVQFEEYFMSTLLLPPLPPFFSLLIH